MLGLINLYCFRNYISFFGLFKQLYGLQNRDSITKVKNIYDRYLCKVLKTTFNFSNLKQSYFVKFQKTLLSRPKIVLLVLYKNSDLTPISNYPACIRLELKEICTKFEDFTEQSGIDQCEVNRKKLHCLVRCYPTLGDELHNGYSVWLDGETKENNNKYVLFPSYKWTLRGVNGGMLPGIQKVLEEEIFHMGNCHKWYIFIKKAINYLKVQTIKAYLY